MREGAPEGMELSARSRRPAQRCPFCFEEVEGDEAAERCRLTCVDCHAVYHLGCVAEASPRRCGVCGGQVQDERPARGVATRAWRSARRPRTWGGWLAIVLAVLLAAAGSLGIVAANLTSSYFVVLIVVLAACVGFNLVDGRWELSLTVRERGPRPGRRNPKSLKR